MESASIETITVAKAKSLLANNKANRPINDSNLKVIEMEMKRSNFESTGESIKVAIDGTLLDGQHRLMAIVNTSMPQKMLIVRGLDKNAFKYIDTGRKRTAADVLGIEKIKNPTQIATMVKFIMNFKRGQYISATQSQTKRASSAITNSDVSDFVAKNLTSLNDSYPFGYAKENKLLPCGLLASLHYILKGISQIEADDFCWKVAKGENLTKENPIYLLRQKLLNDIRSNRKMSKTERLALVLKAWNLYRGKKKVSILKWESVREAFPKPI